MFAALSDDAIIFGQHRPGCTLRSKSASQLPVTNSKNAREYLYGAEEEQELGRVCLFDLRPLRFVLTVEHTTSLAGHAVQNRDI